VSLDNAVPTLNIDLRLNPAGMSVDMAFALKTLEPFGLGNPVPIFGLYGVKIEKITSLSGGKHLKLLCRKNENAFQAILFGTAQQQFPYLVGDIVDLAVTLDINLYQGKHNLSIQIKSIKSSNLDQDDFFESKKQFDDFMSDYDCDFISVFPSRAEVGNVYKLITAAPINGERLKSIYTQTGYAKTQVAVKTLCELELISLNNGVWVSNVVNKKSDLMNSEIYKKLYERVNGNE
jgi:single-stranded-DNA-specific exonuclease